MPAKRKVLVTGGAGLIGGVLIDRLKDRYDLSSLDLKKAEGARSIVGDLSDMGTVLSAFKGQHTVVHLAADRRADGPWDSNLPNNFVGTYNVFEAAKQCGVKRVVFASSQHATGGFYLDEPYKAITEGRFKDVPRSYSLVDETCPVRPDGYYGAAKAFGEAIGSYYWDYHKLSSLHLRIGWVISTDDPSFSAWGLTLWLSHADVGQIVRLCIDAPASLGYDVFYAMSDNKWKIFSIEKAKRVLGYKPQNGAADDLRSSPIPKRDR